MKALSYKNFHLSKLEIFMMFLSGAMIVSLSYGIYLIIWFAVSPLIYLAFINDYRKMLVVGILYGAATSTFAFNCLYDITLSYDLVLYLLTIFIFTVYFSLFLAIVSFSAKKIKSSYVVLLPPVVWLVLLLVYSLFPIQIFWMDFAIFHPVTAPLIWYTGSYGITFIILLFNSAIACYFLKKNKNMVLLGIVLAFLILAAAIYSSYGNSYEFLRSEGKLKVALLQGNFPYEWEWRQKNAFGVILDTYINLTFQASKEKPDIIIWPEYSLADDITKNSSVFKKLNKTAQRLNTTLVIGSISYVGSNGNFKDTAFVFKPDGSLDRYDSVKPFFLEKGIVAGNSSNIIRQNNKKFGIAICNEESIKSIARDYTNKGSQFIISMSNDQDFGRGIYVISQFSKLRAAENAKYLVRATNDGVTQIADPFGKAVYSVESKKQKILIEEIYLNSYQTFYAKYENTLVYLLIIASIFFMLKKR